MFPVAPKPVTGATLLPPAGGKANALRPLKIVPASAPSVPRKVLRFQLSLNAIDLRLLLYVVHHGSDAVDFHERLARQSSNSHGGASGTAIRKVRLEHRVHAVVVVQLREIHCELKNAVHSTAACFDDSLYAVHHHLSVHFDRRCFAGVRFVAARMCALSGDVNQTIVNDKRRDETLAGRFSIAVEFLDGAGALSGRCRRFTHHSREAEAWQERGQASG